MAAPIDMDACVSTHILGTSDDAPKIIVAEINKKSAKFVEFIEILEKYLTATEPVPRSRATSLIGAVIDLLPSSFLASEQVELVANFLQAKLSDHHSVQPSAVQALAVLTGRCTNLPDGLPESICSNIFRELQNQSLSHSDRRATYTIFQNLLVSSLKALQAMGGDFVIGFIQQADTEKDPRNLLLVFSCAQFICANFKLGPFSEEMFEILGCYFPIDFTPPSNDPHGITREQLVLALRKCFASTTQFAPLCLPLLIEKMTADLQSARADAFDTLTQCAPVYGRSGLTPFIGSINSCAKREVLMNISSDLVNCAKTCVTAVYTAMAPEKGVDVSKDETLVTPCVELYQDVSKFLDGSDTARSCLACSLCLAVASSCASALCAMAPLVLPALLTKTKEELQLAESSSFMKEMSTLISILKQYKSLHECQKLVGEFKESLWSVLTSAMASSLPESQMEGMKCVTAIITESLLDVGQDMCREVTNTIVTIARNTEDKNLRRSALSSLNEIMKAKPSIGQEIQETLKNSIKSGGGQLAQEVLVSCVWDKSSFTEVSNFLLSLISQPLTETSLDVVELSQSVLQLLERHVRHHEASAEVVADTTAVPLLKCAVTLVPQWSADEKSSSQAALLMSVFRDAFRTIAACIKQRSTESLWDVLQRFYLQGDTHKLGLVGDSVKYKPLEPQSPWQQTRLLALLEGFVEGANIQWMVENREAVFESCFTFALKCADQFSHEAACKAVASMVNKATLGSQIQWFIEPIKEQTRKALEEGDSSEAKCRALTMWTWITKAMECRGHSASALFSTYLVSMLKDPGLGAQAAVKLGFCLQDCPDIFSPSLHATVTPLYKQRFFSINLKALLDGYKVSKGDDVKQNHLTAISLIASQLPLPVLKPHLSKVVPLLLSYLRGSSREASPQVLATLSCALTVSPDLLVNSLDSLVPQLLTLGKTHPAMKVRIAALECLCGVSGLASHVVAPLQGRVVRELASALDDKKRLVRGKAVEARSAWILLEKAS